MSEFVDACRREWRRLGVPDAVAAEMAADLEADLEEADAEGASAQDVLGTSAFDPAAFAAAWAAERGVVHSAPAASRVRRRGRVLAAIAIPAAVAVVGAVLALVPASSGSTRVALAPFVKGPNVRLRLLPGMRVPRPRPPLVQRLAPGPFRPLAVRVNDRHVYLRTVGLILLIVGVGGLVLAATTLRRPQSGVVF